MLPDAFCFAPFPVALPTLTTLTTLTALTDPTALPTLAALAALVPLTALAAMTALAALAALTTARRAAPLRRRCSAATDVADAAPRPWPATLHRTLPWAKGHWVQACRCLVYNGRECPAQHSKQHC